MRSRLEVLADYLGEGQLEAKRITTTLSIGIIYRGLRLCENLPMMRPDGENLKTLLL